MFKNMLIFRIAGDFNVNAVDWEAALSGSRFVPCGASEEQSLGWVEPRDEANGPLVESVGGQLLLKAMVETRTLPASEIAKQAKLRAAVIEQETGRKPGKKEMNEIKEQVRLELMPRAFSKETAVLVWIDPVNRWVAVGAGSLARADPVLTLLLQCVSGLGVVFVETQKSPSAAMSIWLLTQEAPGNFSVDRECVLKAGDESKTTVKYGEHPLDIDEVSAHVKFGMMPVSLAMTWDGRVSFVLTDKLQVKKIKFTNSVMNDKAENQKDEFDTNFAIFTGEMVKFLPELIGALDGLQEAG